MGKLVIADFRLQNGEGEVAAATKEGRRKEGRPDFGAAWLRSSQWRLVPCAPLRGCYANAASARDERRKSEG